MNTHFDPELARLDFEDRLVALCEDPDLPLLERARLLGIAAGRVDVFFMTRVGRLKRLLAARESSDDELKTLAWQLDAVTRETHLLTGRIYRLLTGELLPALAAEGIHIEQLDTLDRGDRDALVAAHRDTLRAEILPVVVTGDAPFPHVRNLRPALLAVRGDAAAGLLLAELPSDRPRLVRLRDTHRFVPLEQVIAAVLAPTFDIEHPDDAHVFRVTRNASASFDGARDVLTAVEREVVRRPFQEVVRIETDDGMPRPLRQRLLGALQREEDLPAATLRDVDLFTATHLLDLTALEELAALDVPRLKCVPIPARRTTLATRRVLDATPVEALLHFPFDDYEASLEHFLTEAAEDPRLESMQTTIYRTDENSGVVRALRAARRRGADVSVVVELKASFDERDNVELARSLGEAGVRVILSPPDLKVHAKIALVGFRGGAGDPTRRVALIGTGNMNAVTARSYVDLWLVTTHPECTEDLATVFEVLTGRARTPDCGCLLVAPFNLRQRFLDLIDREVEHATAGRASGIRAMMNGLTDSAIIAALNRASQAGVPIDLAVRGISLLRPGVPNISDTIGVVSLAGQLLQHARIFHFVNGGDDRYFIGSADWRPRNFDHRVEVVAPVRDRDNLRALDRILSDALASPDAWVLGSDGVYMRRSAATPTARRRLA